MNRRSFLGLGVGAGASVLTCGQPRPSLGCPDPAAPSAEDLQRYTWLDASTRVRPLRPSVIAPDGYARVIHESGSFGEWLRTLPLRATGTPVKSYAGDVLHEGDDGRIAAVVEVDCGKADLQQCADSAIRMHAEWLWSKGDKGAIGYHFLSGDLATWKRYAAGERPSVKGNKVTWSATAKASETRDTFRAYLDMVFMYASTMSLAKESQSIDKKDLLPGDFFIQPGGPGHCVLILDVAVNLASGERAALLGQGFMPAQDFQVLASAEPSLGPWFSLDDANVDTPFWPAFEWSALHRFQRQT
jgi:hypothetical protein